MAGRGRCSAAPISIMPAKSIRISQGRDSSPNIFDLIFRVEGMGPERLERLCFSPECSIWLI